MKKYELRLYSNYKRMHTLTISDKGETIAIYVTGEKHRQLEDFLGYHNNERMPSDLWDRLATKIANYLRWR